MPNVVRLLPPVPNAETIAALRMLVERAEHGEIADVALCFTDCYGRESAVWTGKYKDPEVSLRAALHWSAQLVDQAFSHSQL